MSAHDELSLQIFRLYPEQIKALCELYYINGNVDELLDSLDAIHSVEQARRKIKVATLNFSGVNLNPFEYHDGSDVMQAIDAKMKSIIEIEGKNLEKTKFSKLDKNYTEVNKMSVRFGTGICDGDSLPNREEYLRKWRECFERNAGS